MNKTNFSKKWSFLLKDYYINSLVSPEDSKFIFDSLSKTKTYYYIEPDKYYLQVKNITIANKRQVKMFCAKGKKFNRQIPISKSKVVEQLYPPKKRKETNKTDSNFTLLQVASRNIVEPQIKKYRGHLSLPVNCPSSGVELRHWGDIHIDHVYPLVQLFKDWLDLNDLNPNDIALKGPKNNKTFKEESLTDSWYNYHLDNAKLQPLHKRENLSKGDNF